MACPFFVPGDLLDPIGFAAKPMPLGDACGGECRAGSETAWPEVPELRELCNLGYARGRCRRFPDSAQDDAVRFAVSRDEQGAVAVMFVYERGHRPGMHGTLQYSEAGNCFLDAEGILAAQAQAYVRAYLRRRIARPAQIHATAAT